MCVAGVGGVGGKRKRDETKQLGEKECEHLPHVTALFRAGVSAVR